MIHFDGYQILLCHVVAMVTQNPWAEGRYQDPNRLFLNRYRKILV